MPDTQIVRQQYDCFADIYGVIWRGYTKRTLPLLMSAARIAPGERVLDIGSGTDALGKCLGQTVPRAEVAG